jgi:uncharacterized membrane protein YgdD (TMEM256/DUF423 family)
MFKTLHVFPLMGWCAVFICLSIVFGAFGSHALTKVLSVQKLDVFNKANHYLAIQSIGILVLLLVNHAAKIQISPQSIYALLAGTVIFCLALYLVSFSELEGLSWLRKFGAVAPIGGTLMVIGWAIAAFNFFKGTVAI